MSEPIYTPEFIPYYWKETHEYGFTDKEALLYGFIRFYTKNASKRFYFDNEHLAHIIRSSERTVTSALAKFDTLGIFEIVYENKAKGGTIRFIKPGRKNCESGSRLAKIASPTSKNCESALEENGKNVQANNKIKRNKSNFLEKSLESHSDRKTPPSSDQSPSLKENDYPESNGSDFQEFLGQKKVRKIKRQLKKKYNGSVPPWVDVDKLVEKEVRVNTPPPSVTITQEYRDFCSFISEDRKAIHIATVEGQRLWDNLLREGYQPAHIKCASRIAYRVDDFWKNNYTPELFFRKKTYGTGEAIDHVGKFLNARANDNPTITEIKQEMKNELEQ